MGNAKSTPSASSGSSDDEPVDSRSPPGTWYKATFKPYVDRVDEFESKHGDDYHAQVVRVQPKSMKVFVPETDRYEPIDIRPDPVEVTVHGIRTPRYYGSPVKVTTKIRIKAKHHRFWPPSRSLGDVPPHYRERARPDQPPEDRTELDSVPLPRSPMSWESTVATAPKPTEWPKPRSRRSSRRMRKVSIGPVRVGNIIEEISSSEDSDDEALLGLVGDRVDPNANSRVSKRTNSRTRRRIVDLKHSPGSDPNLVLVNTTKSPKFDSVFMARRHDTGLRGQTQEQADYKRGLEGRQGFLITPENQGSVERGRVSALTLQLIMYLIIFLMLPTLGE